MEFKVIKQEKDNLEVEIGNLTIAELLRKELWNDSKIDIAVWKREHPAKNPVLIVKVKEGTAKKALSDAIARLQKINDKLLEEFKKALK